jgi:hypothetical protein
MANEILPYLEMCRREGVSLQRGLNFELGGNHSVILMSVRPGGPYADLFEDDGSTIISSGNLVSFTGSFLRLGRRCLPSHTPRYCCHR